VACEAGAEMHNMLTRIEKKLKYEHSALELGKALSVAYPEQMTCRK
jgi:hypothetical protein